MERTEKDNKEALLEPNDTTNVYAATALVSPPSLVSPLNPLRSPISQRVFFILGGTLAPSENLTIVQLRTVLD